VQRLIEYKKYKEAASNLQELETDRAQVFTRPPSDLTGLAAHSRYLYCSCPMWLC